MIPFAEDSPQHRRPPHRWRLRPDSKRGARLSGQYLLGRTALFVRLLATAAVLFSALLILRAPSAFAQEKSLVWERFDVDIIIRQDGAFDVAEYQSIRFASGTFTFGFRDIPKNNFNSLSNWSITDSSGNRYRLVNGGNEPYTFTVADQGARYVIYWYFPAIASRSETYTLTYTVHGGLRYYEGGDQLWWKAVYDDHSFPVQAGRVNVVAPAAIQEWAAYINRGEAVAEDARGEASATLLESGREIVFEINRRLSAGEGFEVRVEFAPGVVAGEPQPWQSRADAEAAELEAAASFRNRWGPILTLGFGALGMLFLFGGPALLYLLWYRLGPRQTGGDGR